MSYIGRLPIKIPEEVRVSISGNALVVRGPAGVEYPTPIDGISYKISADGSFLHVELADERWKPFWGMARTLASNLIIGVSRQFTLSRSFPLKTCFNSSVIQGSSRLMFTL